MTCQKPTPQALKILLTQKDHPDHKLMLKFYLEFVLTSESIDKERFPLFSAPQRGFYVNNENKIEFDTYCFLREEEEKFYYVSDHADVYYRKDGVHKNLLFHAPSKKWHFDTSDIDEKSFIKFEKVWDELYFKSRRKAKDIHYVKLSANSYKEVKTDKECLLLNKKELEYPITIEYRYKKLNGLLMYTKDNSELLLLKVASPQEKEQLKKVGIWTKEGSKKLFNRGGKPLTFKAIKKQLEKGQLHQRRLYPAKIFNRKKSIRAEKIFYLNEATIEAITKEEFYEQKGVFFALMEENRIYRFNKTHLRYGSTKDDTLKYIALKREKSEGNGTKKYIFEPRVGAVFNKIEEGYTKERRYSMKFSNYKGEPVKENYTIYSKEEVVELSTSKDKNIYYKKVLQIGSVRVDIFNKKCNIKPIALKKNHIVMRVPSEQEFKNDYLKMLYRLRNSIAHAEFNIREDEVFFCNTHNDELNLKANVLRCELDGFMEGLLEMVL